jgi:hypothetical protein
VLRLQGLGLYDLKLDRCVALHQINQIDTVDNQRTRGAKVVGFRSL